MKWKYFLAIPVVLFLITAYSVYVVDESVSQATVNVIPKDERYSEVKPVKVDELFTLVNIEREKAGIKPLILDERLNASSATKVADMQTTGLTHVNTDGERGYMGIFAVMNECTHGAENLSGTGYGSWNVVEAWMASKEGHRESILNPDYDYVGYSTQGIWVAQHFCDID